MSTKLKIGIFGGGVVGGGVYKILSDKMQNNPDKLKKIGIDLVVSKICVRSLDKKRDYTLGSECEFVTNYDDILLDNEINCVVEVMGGVTDAKDIVFKAIKQGKHVITANKALVAKYLNEIKDLLNENKNVKFCYEAAVCGGIPIIHSLQSDFLGDNITKIMGIMNGTTNFMLSKMEKEGASYEDVLKEAQDLGFAEADPTADVEGHDVQAKIALLSNLAYGQVIPINLIPTSGISNITATDFEYAKILGSTIKLIGCANLENEKLSVYVSPMIVPLDSALSSATGAGNMVLVKSKNNTESIFAGPGAGRYPTANSVINDIFRLNLGQTTDPFPLEESLEINNNYESSFYVRINVKDDIGIIKSVGEKAEAANISIHSILQNPIISHDNLNFVVTTEKCFLLQIENFIYSLEKCSFTLSKPLFMPIC